MDKPSITVRMLRDNLDDIPQFSLPDGFAFHWYQHGDERHWVEIEHRADGIDPARGAPMYVDNFGSEVAVLAERQCFLVDTSNGEFAGTASAWFHEGNEFSELGRIHWVAIVPEYQGRGLAKPLLTALCNRLRELGHRRAMLTTHTHRLPAIRLYRKFGFQPWIETDEEREAWSSVSFE